MRVDASQLFKKILIVFLWIPCLPANSMDIDYTHIWRDAPVRDQGEVGNCHSFTMVALFEARYYKEHYVYKAYSPYDLFTNHMLDSIKIFKSRSFMTHPLDEFITYRGDETLEGGNEFSNLKLIKKYGLALDEQMPYPEPKSVEMNALLDSVRMNAYIWQHAFHEQDLVEVGTDVFSCNKVRKNIKSIYKDNALNGFYQNDGRELFKEERNEVKNFVKGLRLKKTSYLGHWRGTKKERMVSYLRCNPLLVGVKNYEKLVPKDKNQTKFIKDEKEMKNKSNSILHSVLLVGFIEASNDFLIKNSWGYDIERFDADKFSVHVHDAAYLKRGFEKFRNCTYAENPIRYQ